MKLTDSQKELIKKYGHLFVNTGGNELVEFLERTDISSYSNIVAFVMQVSCANQLQLLENLIMDNRLEQYDLP